MKRAKLKITNEQLGNMLKLKPGIKLTTADSYVYNNSTIFILESEGFPEVTEGAQMPGLDISEVIETPQYKYQSVIEHSLSFAEAMDKLYKGAAITRSIWFGYWKLEKIEGLSNPIIVATCKDDSRVPASPYQEDMIANDWMVVSVVSFTEVKNRLTKEDIDEVIRNVEYTRTGNKTTIALVTLRNGFEVTGESACVDPANFDERIGQEIALANAKEKIWLLEGYLLQDKLYEGGFLK